MMTVRISFNKRALLIKKGKKAAIQFSHVILEVQEPEQLSQSKLRTGVCLVSPDPSITPSPLPFSPHQVISWHQATQAAQVSFGSCFWDGSRSVTSRHFTPAVGGPNMDLGIGYLHTRECMLWEKITGAFFPESAMHRRC